MAHSIIDDCSPWKLLSPYPFCCSDEVLYPKENTTQTIVINHNKFITFSSIFRSHFIYIYTISKNKWCKSMRFSSKIKHLAIDIDKNSNILYVCCDSELFPLNIKSKSFRSADTFMATIRVNVDFHYTSSISSTDDMLYTLYLISCIFVFLYNYPFEISILIILFIIIMFLLIPYYITQCNYNNNINKWNVTRTSSFIRLYGSSCIVIDGIFHLFGGYNDTAHYIWNNNTKSFKLIHNFKIDIINAGVVYIKSKNIILLFGGYNNNFAVFNTIYQYNCDTNIWIKLKYIYMPQKLHSFGCVVTRDDQYVLILGGCNCKFISNNNIFIFNVNKQLFIKSKINIPININWEQTNVVIVNNYSSSVLCSYGFARRLNNNICLCLGDDVLKVIAEMFTMERVHLLNNHVHLTIDVFEILNNHN